MQRFTSLNTMTHIDERWQGGVNLYAQSLLVQLVFHVVQSMYSVPFQTDESMHMFSVPVDYCS